VSDDWLTPEVVAAVKSHMDADHSTDSVTICRGVGDRPGVVEATMTGMDHDAIEFDTVDADGNRETLRIPFSRPLTARPDVREQVADLYERSAKRLS
jgi:hypothetical protein